SASIRLPPPRPHFCVTEPAPTAISTLSLHDALPILKGALTLYIAITIAFLLGRATGKPAALILTEGATQEQINDLNGKLGFNDPDRKSTRLNSSHVKISYAVFCLKKKKKHRNGQVPQ